MQGLQSCLLAFALIKPQVLALNWTTGYIISQLNGDFKTTLNVYIDCEHNQLLLPDILKSSTTPNLLLSSNFDLAHNSAQQPLLGRFAEPALTIAYLEASSMNRTLGALVQLLWRLHHLPVLYILPAGFDQLRQVFEHALANGFLRVLVLREDQLYTYQPYPQIKLLALQNLSDFRQLTRLRNLQGQEVILMRDSSSPRCFQYTNRQGRRVYAGYIYELVHQFIVHYNGTERGIFDEHDPISISLGMPELLARRFQIVTRLLHPMDWQWFTSSIMLYHMNVLVIAPYARPLPEAYYFLRPFSSSLWLAVIAGIFYCALLLSWLYRRHQPGYSLAATFLEVLQFFIFLPPSYNPRQHLSGWRYVCVFLVLSLTGFMLTNLYLAQMHSIMTAGLYEPQVRFFNDLARSKLRLMQDAYDEAYLRNLTQQTDLNPILLAHTAAFPTHEQNEGRQQLNMSYLHSAYDDRIYFVLYQQKFLRVPLFKIIDDFYYRTPFFIPVSYGLPYFDLLNSYMRRIWESGIFAKLQGDAHEQGIISGELSFRFTTGLETRIIDMTFYYFAYSLLVMGWTLSLLVFVGERTVRRWQREKFENLNNES